MIIQDSNWFILFGSKKSCTMQLTFLCKEAKLILRCAIFNWLYVESAAPCTRDDLLARNVTLLKVLRKSPFKEVSVIVNVVGRDIRLVIIFTLAETSLDRIPCAAGVARSRR